jgi:CPA2 family monovalent cation:H+ antiporter-2
VELLEENQVTPTVVELNHETVKALRKGGRRAVYGDASQEQILLDAGIQQARSLVLSTPTTGAPAVIRAARALNPELLVVARADFLSELPELRAAGAQVVVSAEGEVAIALTEGLLARLGATAEQLDRARERIRENLA